MIGGIEVPISTQADLGQAIHLCLRVIRRYWPDAIVEDGTTGERQPAISMAAAPETTREVVIYKNNRLMRKWDKVGAVAGLSNTMVHILGRPGGLVLVVDDLEEEPIRSMLEWIKNGLSMDIFRVPARRKPRSQAA